jgi:hypothetical protein
MHRTHPSRLIRGAFALALVWTSGRAIAQDPPAAPAAPEAAASEPAATQESDSAKTRKAREQELKAMPVARVAAMRDVVQFAIENDDLIVRTSIPTTDGSAVVIGDRPTLMSVAAHHPEGVQGSPYVPMYFMLINHEYPPAGGVSIAHVNVVGQRVQVSRNLADEGEHNLFNVDLIQDDAFLEEGDDRVRFYVQVIRGGEEQLVDLKLSAPNITELRRKYPVETMRYLEPIFREFGQASVLFQVNNKAAWQVLGGAATTKPSPELSAKVDALLVKLDADDAREREAALAELEKIGQPAALLLMQRDRKGLSEEQRARVETFLAPYKPLTDDEAGKMRGDAEFLLMALSSDDDALAALALERLKQVAKQPITFDLATSGPTRTEAIAALRAKLLPAATQPATTRTFIKSGSDTPAPVP